jgi:hypothetical protein
MKGHIVRVMFASAMAYLATSHGVSAATPVTLSVEGKQTCLFPTVNENIEIRDVSAEISVSGPLLALQEVLLTARGATPSQSQDMYLPVVLADPSGQIYTLHASVLFFAYKDAQIELGFTGSIAGQQTFLRCNLAGVQGFPNP